MSDAFKTKPNTPKLQYSNTPITRMMSRSYLYREREVMALVVREFSNKQIAAELGTKE